MTERQVVSAPKWTPEPQVLVRLPAGLAAFLADAEPKVLPFTGSALLRQRCAEALADAEGVTA